MAVANMSTHDIHDAHDHEHSGNFITKYIFSTDHKMIAKQYLVTGMFWAIIGGFLSILFRLQLGFPDMDMSFLKPLLGGWINETGQLDPNFYLALVTMHGTIMVFFVLTAGLSGTFANFLILLQIGARDMASGFLNMLSYWFFFLSGVIMFISLFLERGPAGGGWTVYPPLSALEQAIPGSGAGMTLWLVAMVLFITSQLMAGINYITTVINMRTKGMSFSRLPLTVWALFLTAVVGLLAFPVLFGAALLLFFDRSFGTSFYLSDIYIGGEPLPHVGGSAVLYQHLCWFLGHPEVYIVILPAFGISSEIISTNARKPIFGYRAMIGSLMAIAFLSFIVWAHHMFISGMNPFLGSVFVFTTLLIAIPSAVKAFNYTTTLWKGNLRLTTAMLFSIGMVSTFVSGGLTGIIVADSTLDINVHDTYFVVAHFHTVMGLSAILAMLAGVYHWFPKMFGRMMNTKMGYAHFWFTIIAGYGVFLPMHFVGIAGAPRRYYQYTDYPMFDAIMDLNIMITVFAIFGAVGQGIFLFNFFRSIFRGQKAVQHPWKSNTLEWTTPVEHIHGNWPGAIPEVYRWPYDYSKPGKELDFVPQNIPLEEGEDEH